MALTIFITPAEVASWIGRDLGDAVDVEAVEIITASVNATIPRVAPLAAAEDVPPDDVRLAALLQAARLYSRRTSPDGIVGISDAGGVRVPWKDPDVVALLAPWQYKAVG